MIRLFHVYYPVSSVALFCGEAVVVCLSFLIAAYVRFGPDSYLVLNFENGFLKILGVTGIALLAGHYFDVYDPENMKTGPELYFRLVVVLGAFSFAIGIVSYVFPEFLVGRGTYSLGMLILTCSLLTWRWTYGLMARTPFLRERVYVLGEGPRAERLISSVRTRPDLAMEVVGWSGAIGDVNSREQLGEKLVQVARDQRIHRVIVAFSDRRGRMPTRELLNLRLSGIRVEEASSLLEQVSGKIEVDWLHPSGVIFADGFNLSPGATLLRSLVSKLIALCTLLAVSPLLPLVALAIKLTSPGPVIYSQNRVGRKGVVFKVHKFRTMRQDAEAGGAKWASKNDPRITRVGNFLRKTRLDELPQLWNVLRGDMAFVGPRPERPEFVQWLADAIPYFHLRHIVPPGLTGWAQVRYRYGSSLEDAKEKLQYDLYYIKHASLALDLLIVFETLKTVILRRGSQ